MTKKGFNKQQKLMTEFTQEILSLVDVYYKKGLKIPCITGSLLEIGCGFTMHSLELPGALKFINNVVEECKMMHEKDQDQK